MNLSSIVFGYVVYLATRGRLKQMANRPATPAGEFVAAMVIAVMAGFAPGPVAAAPKIIDVSTLKPGDRVIVLVPNAKGSNSGLTAIIDSNTYAQLPPGKSTLNGIDLDTNDANGKPLPVGRIRVIGVPLFPEPKVTFSPANNAAPKSPAPAPPGGTGGGPTGAGVGFSAGAEIAPGMHEASIFSLEFVGDLSDVITTPGRFSFGFNDGFIATYDALVNDTLNDIFDSLLASLISNGIAANRVGRRLQLIGAEGIEHAGVASYLAEGLHFDMTIRTVDIAEPSVLLLIAMGLLVCLGLGRERGR